MVAKDSPNLVTCASCILNWNNQCSVQLSPSSVHAEEGPRNVPNTDFTINDSANASKPVSRLKMSSPSSSAVPAELSWDGIDTDHADDIIKEVGEDVSKKFVCNSNNNPKVDDDLENRPGVLYPEILFYHISRYIEPEQIGNFAGINRACYACTKREAFWLNFYKEYCQNHSRLPECLKIENSCKEHGLKQKVIRALFHTYIPFYQSAEWYVEDPDFVVGRFCVKVWYYEETESRHYLFFKLKNVPPQRPDVDAGNMIEELGCIDANPEEDCQVLQITCQSVQEVPPVMGMTLTKASLAWPQEDSRYRRVDLSFSTSSHNISRGILSEKSVVVDNVLDIRVLDWWHPRYPHFGIPCYFFWRRKCGTRSLIRGNIES